MTVSQVDINALIGTYGLAVALIVVIVVFGLFWYWPWYKERIKQRDEAEEKRHVSYMGTIDRFTTAMNAVNVTMSSTAQLIAGMVDRIDDNHREVMSELRRKP